MKRVVSRRDEARGLRLAAGQPESAGEFVAFLNELRERIAAAVLEEDLVRSRLDGRRFALVAADYREDKPKAGAEVRRLAEIGFYDYDDDVLVVAVVDPRGGQLLELDERAGVQPPVTEEELTAAKRIAGRAGRAARSRRVVAFPTPPYRLGSERARHRCSTLYLPAGRGRAETEELVIDLSAEEVVPEDEVRPGPPDTGPLDGNEGRP